MSIKQAAMIFHHEDILTGSDAGAVDASALYEGSACKYNL